VRQPRFSKLRDVQIGEGTVILDHVNLYKCKIGRNCKVDSYVFIEEGVEIGDNCKIKPFVFIPKGVTIEDDVFIGPNVVFTNDRFPRSTNPDGVPKSEKDWKLERTLIRKGSSIGAGAVILPGIIIGRDAMVGAGSVVTSDVADGATVVGNPARPVDSQRTR
jgi:acetyltransferase-like isoleucine patch superfamily enzyme